MFQVGYKSKNDYRGSFIGLVIGQKNYTNLAFRWK
jgi:hypothetical protein